MSSGTMSFDGEALEALAAVEHERWSHWQRYLHGRCIRNDDGSLTISAEDAARWERQMRTTYSMLSDDEKDSDREQAQHYLDALEHLERGLGRP